MQEFLQKIIDNYPRKTISSRDLENEVVSLMGESAWERAGAYETFAHAVARLVQKGELVPLKASGLNGRVPPLAAKYRLKRSKQYSSEIFSFRSSMDLSYFHRHPEQFQAYQQILQNIDQYLLAASNKEPVVWDTVNERSLALTGDEKFLSSSEGAALLSKINVTLADLHCYKVAEPFFYRQFKNAGASAEINGLIIENKDTFASISRLLERSLLRFSPALDLIIYGEGNKITKSWTFIETIPWVSGKTVNLYYFGDLDPEGFKIYHRLLSQVNHYNSSMMAKAVLQLELAESLYALLLQQGLTRPLHKPVDDKDISILSISCMNFSPELRISILELWLDDKMIPQEALSASRLAELGVIKL
ncbi:MAG: hypothetical protein GX044_07420 [Firmicutes bacterium]|nr:hypothetical protein [Bacillota bacterium]